MYDQRRIEELIAKFEAGVRDAEMRKVRSEVFDAETLRVLYKLMEKGVLDRLEGIISTGKEANVFRARAGDALLAVKIYRIETTEFRHMWKYIDGDPRFLRVRRNRRGIIFAWTRKEYKNLEQAYKHGVPVPTPYAYMKNVLVMDFIGEGERPAPLLKDVLPDDPSSFAEALLDAWRKLYFEAGLVHADMSEYNILVHNGPVLIDFGQAVPWDHPLSHEFFLRDMERAVKILRMLGREMPLQELVRKLREV